MYNIFQKEDAFFKFSQKTLKQEDMKALRQRQNKFCAIGS